MSDSKDLGGRVAQACRVLGKLDLTKAATGHVSARVPGTDRILIRARGPGELGVRYTTDDQVIECDLDGKLVRGGEKLTAPLEVFIHTAVYKARPSVQAVVHVHPPTVVLFTICDKPLQILYGSYDPPSAGLALDGIPTYPRSILISTPELGDDLARAMGTSPVCMMRGHGITTAAASIEEAALYAIHLNELAVMNYQAHLLGDPRPISEADQAVFRAMKPGRDSEQGPFAGRSTALWNYYVALTGA
jgi:ribulose-5-phosphate 4-epimerase/fuculose-1-phosphate aldolase